MPVRWRFPEFDSPTHSLRLATSIVDNVEKTMFKSNFKPDPADFVIVVMGPTGSGKTNFINKLTGNIESRKVSSLKPDTQDVIPYPASYQDLRVVMVDTPGFGDACRPDNDILRAAADWLVQKYSNGTTLKIAGIIYFHEISYHRKPSSAHRNLRAFRRLCDNISIGRTCLVTTMWDQRKDKAVASQRENELKIEFWKPLLDGGATVHRFENTSASAWDIVRDLLRVEEGGELHLQEEPVGRKRHLNETKAGRAAYNQHQKTFGDAESPKILLSRRILLWLFRRKSRGHR